MTDSYGSTFFSAAVAILSDGAHHVVRSKSVPAGNYAIFATGLAQDSDHDSFTSCALKAAGTVVAENAAEADALEWEPIAIVGHAGLPNGGTIEFVCWTDDDGVNVSDGSLIALKVGALH